MITIFVGKAKSNINTVFDEADFKMMPNELRAKFLEMFEEYDYFDIRVYTDTIINAVGELIEEGFVSWRDFEIITEFGTHVFNEEGHLGPDWPYGIFNY